MAIDYVAHLRRDGALMAAAAGKDMSAHVPTCPEWDMTQLVTHTGRHHRWVSNAVNGGGAEPADTTEPGLRGEELIDWFRQGWEDLAELLEGMPDETPAWSWAGDNRVGFWKRRTALETLVHRFDAENATGPSSPLDPELAADGVDEAVSTFFPDSESPWEEAAATIGIRTDDVEGAWLVDLRPGEIPRGRRHQGAHPDVTISGPAADTLLYLWGRYREDAIAVSGDEGAFRRFNAWLTA